MHTVPGAVALPPHVVIVGGGFTGAVTAVQLARAVQRPVVIDIVEPRDMLGTGVAYSAADPAHRINVPASKMTVFADDPTQFDRWLRACGTLEADPEALWPSAINAAGDAFPQRRVFGRYVAGLVADAAGLRPDVPIRHHRTVATDIAAGDAGLAVHLEDGGRIDAALVVLAVSHPPPAVPAALRDALSQGAPIVADPWRDGALDAIRTGSDVLIVGTGLTMADVVASLERRGHRGRITAMSRRGLLSRGHSASPGATWAAFETAEAPATALGLSRAIRAQVRQARLQEVPWQAVFDDVRTNAGRLWAALGTDEKRRVVRHLRPFWDVHRFRVSPQAAEAVARLQAAGRFRVLTASLIGAGWDGTSLDVRLRERRGGHRADRVLRVAAAVVTTGPAHASILQTNPALASLARQALVCADEAGLGLLVDGGSHAVGAAGRARPDLLVAGPLARGRFGELMGLPQVSANAMAVAREAAAFLDARSPAG